MAGRIWLDKDGKVLVNSAGRVFLSDTCCCGTVKGTCWQLYSATVITGQDSVLSWSEPVFVDYQCATTPILGRDTGWKWYGFGAYNRVATAWYAHEGSCAVCSSPLGAEYPDLSPDCDHRRLFNAADPMRYIGGRIGVFSVVTYSRLRDELGDVVGLQALGTMLVPNWRLTDVTPDDSDDLVYSQVPHPSARYCYGILDYSLAVADQNNTYLHGAGDWYGWSTDITYHTVYSTCGAVAMLANGVGLVGSPAWDRYALDGQGAMLLTEVGSRYSAVPDEVISVSSATVTLGCPLASVMFGANQWGNLEIGISMYIPDWCSKYIHVTAQRIARGGWAGTDFLSSTARELAPPGLSESMMPGWVEYVWISCDAPLSKAADYYIDAAVSGTIRRPGMSILYTKCATNWYRVIGLSWEGCPNDGTGVFDNWTTVYTGTPGQLPTHMLLDTVIPLPTYMTPFNGISTAHEDDDALAAGSTVWRAYSLGLGDGHYYKWTQINYDNYPAWRSELCPTVFEPVSVEVPQLAWRAADLGRLAYPGEANVASASMGWPLGNFHFAGTSGDGWTHESVSYYPIYPGYTMLFTDADMSPTIFTDYLVISKVPTTVTLRDFNDEPIIYSAKTKGLLITGDLQALGRFPGGALYNFHVMYNTPSTYFETYTGGGIDGAVEKYTATGVRYLTGMITAGVLKASLMLDGLPLETWRACGGVGVSAWPLVSSLRSPADIVIYNNFSYGKYDSIGLCDNGILTTNLTGFPIKAPQPDWAGELPYVVNRAYPYVPLDYLQLNAGYVIGRRIGFARKVPATYTLLCDYKVDWRFSQQGGSYSSVGDYSVSQSYFCGLRIPYSYYLSTVTVGDVLTGLSSRIYTVQTSCNAYFTIKMSEVSTSKYSRVYGNGDYWYTGYVEYKSFRTTIDTVVTTEASAYFHFYGLSNSIGVAPVLVEIHAGNNDTQYNIDCISHIDGSSYAATRENKDSPWTVLLDTHTAYDFAWEFPVTSRFYTNQLMPRRHVIDKWVPVYYGSVLQSMVTLGEANVSYSAYSAYKESVSNDDYYGLRSMWVTNHGDNVKYALTAHVY